MRLCSPDFPEVQTASLVLAEANGDRQRLEQALRFYADASHWDSDMPDMSLTFLDRGELARTALKGKDQLGSHRDYEGGPTLDTSKLTDRFWDAASIAGWTANGAPSCHRH